MNITHQELDNALSEEIKKNTESVDKILNTPKEPLATVASTGSYNDLNDKPNIPPDNTSKIGDLTALKTTDKINLVGAFNELFQSASDGKNSVATAITNKGVSASSTDTFPSLANKIEQISTGKKFASGSVQLIKQNTLDINNLDFTPKFVIVTFNGVTTSVSTYFGTVIISNPPSIYRTSTTKEPVSGHAWNSTSGFYSMSNKTNMYIKSNGFYYLDTQIYVYDATYSTNIDWYAYE